MDDREAANASILLVSSRDETQHRLRHLLTELGYEVRLVPSAERAMESISDQPPDLLLLGTELPNTDSQELCRRLKASELTREAPVLFVGQALESPDLEERFGAGGDDYVAAPFQPGVLRARVEHHLALAAMRRQLTEARARLELEKAERQRVEDALREAEASGTNLVENLNEVIYAVDERGSLTYVSPAIERLLGYSPAEAIGRPVGTFFHPRTCPAYRSVSKTSFPGRRPAASTAPLANPASYVGCAPLANPSSWGAACPGLRVC